jgi:hypothetical protein
MVYWQFHIPQLIGVAQGDCDRDYAIDSATRMNQYVDIEGTL